MLLDPAFKGETAPNGAEFNPQEGGTKYDARHGEAGNIERAERNLPVAETAIDKEIYRIEGILHLWDANPDDIVFQPGQVYFGKVPGLKINLANLQAQKERLQAHKNVAGLEDQADEIDLEDPLANLRSANGQ